jgi:hypothetical protein
MENLIINHTKVLYANLSEYVYEDETKGASIEIMFERNGYVKTFYFRNYEDTIAKFEDMRKRICQE